MRAKGNIMGDMGRVRGKASRLLAALMSVVLAVGLMPAAAFGVGASVEGEGNFDVATGQQTTSVYLKTHTNLFDIADHTKVATPADFASGIWVQIENGAAPYSASWYAQEVDAEGNAQGERISFGKGEPYDATTQSFYLKIDTLKPNDAIYHFWAEVSDSSNPPLTASNEDDPIIVINSNDYHAGPVTWTPEGKTNWVWSAEGGMISDDGTPNGVDGRILKKTELSASIVSADEVTSQLANAAAAAKRQVKTGYNVAIVPLDDAPKGDVFMGTILMKLDVTDLVSGDEAPSASDLGLIWLDPYAAGGKVVDLKGAPYNMEVIEHDGRTYLGFSLPSAEAGKTGMIGSIAVTAPVSNAEMFIITMTATEGGIVKPMGTIERAKGSTPQFKLYQEFGYVIDSVVAVSASGAESPADGTLEGDTFTLNPLTQDVTLRAKFKKVEVPGPGSDEAARKVTLEVGAADADRATSVSIVGYGDSEVTSGSTKQNIEVDASDPVTLAFNTARGFAVDTVTVTYAGLEGSTTYHPTGAYLELPVLEADAHILVTYKASVIPPVVISYATSAAAIPARAADVLTSSDKGGADDAVTFSAMPKVGWRLTGAQVVYSVVPEGSTQTVETNGRTYTADELESGSVTLYGIVCDTRVDFSFEKIVKDVTFPVSADVPGATLSVSGTKQVDVDSPVKFTVVVDKGYVMPAIGMLFVGNAGETTIGWTGSPIENADGTKTYTFNLTFADIASLGDGIKAYCMPKKDPNAGPDQPGQDEGITYTVTTSAGEHGRITATTTEDAGESVTIWFFPDDGYKIDQVLIDGVPAAQFSSASNEMLLDHTMDAKPYITIAPLYANHTVSATFVASAGSVTPPSVVIKPDPGDLPDNPDPDDPNNPTDPDNPPFTPGGSNVGDEGGDDTPVYKGESQSFTYVSQKGYELDAVLVDGEYIYFDGAHLKDDPALADHKVFTWDEENGVYMFRDSEGETVKFDAETGVLTFGNVQKPHTYLFVKTPVLEVVVNVSTTGGTVHADGTVDGASKILTWKTRKGLTVYMMPDADGGYKLGNVVLDGRVVSASDIQAVSQIPSGATPPMSSLVKDLLLTGDSHASVPVSTAYAYTIPSSYLVSKAPGEVVNLTVPFVKKDAGAGDGNGDDGNQGGNNQGGNNQGNGNQGGNGSGNGTGDGTGSGSDSALGAPGVSNGFAGDATGNGTPMNANGTYTIKAAVKSGQGVLDCAAEQQVRPGAECTVAFKPAVGYQVSALHIDGKRYAYTNRTFTFKNVQAGHTVEAEFAPTGYAGDNGALNRGIRTLQSLAKTGDLNAPAATTLLAVAFGASGIAFLVWSRRRKEEDIALAVEQDE